MTDEEPEALDVRIEPSVDLETGVRTITFGVEGFAYVQCKYGETGLAVLANLLQAAPQILEQAVAALDKELAQRPAESEEEGEDG